MIDADLKNKFLVAAATLALSLIAFSGPSWGNSGTGVQTSCGGDASDNWTFTTDALDGRFLHVIWTGPQGETRVSTLNYYATNTEGYPVFTGTFLDVAEVILVDKSGGAPKNDSEVMVFTEDWGWVAGNCRELGKTGSSEVSGTEFVRKTLVGSRDASATNWLQRNGFARESILEFSEIGKIELWQMDQGDAIEVVFYHGIVSDVHLALK
ncbi:hypothetical protein [Ruegeria atlantica]|uniref:hypothetical protein n=1 Tax=Ruegeria atlantica TaxID=81569 RepID=UPI001480B9A6|nr:hypothetical protein [Ruegeria atlantica]